MFRRQINNGDPVYLDNDDPTEAEYKMLGLRAKRNALLAECDSKVIADVSVGEEKKTEWLEYRQALRDWTSTVSDPLNPPEWPTKPE
jgi:hypothetical protein